MSVQRQILVYLFVGLLMLTLVGLPLLSIGTIVHGTISSEWSAFHIAAWVHIALLVAFAVLVEPPKMWRR